MDGEDALTMSDDRRLQGDDTQALVHRMLDFFGQNQATSLLRQQTHYSRLVAKLTQTSLARATVDALRTEDLTESAACLIRAILWSLGSWSRRCEVTDVQTQTKQFGLHGVGSR